MWYDKTVSWLRSEPHRPHVVPETLEPKEEAEELDAGNSKSVDLVPLFGWLRHWSHQFASKENSLQEAALHISFCSAEVILVAGHNVS